MKPVLITSPHRIFIGSGVLIRPGFRLEVVEGRAGARINPRVVIGDRCNIEQNFHLACAAEIVIGNNVSITENVGIFDIWHPYEDISMPIKDQALRTAPVKIGEGSFIGMGAVIQPGVNIGRNCLIAANSVVTKDIPDYSIAAGAPARIIKRYDGVAKEWQSSTRSGNANIA